MGGPRVEQPETGAHPSHTSQLWARTRRSFGRACSLSRATRFVQGLSRSSIPMCDRAAERHTCLRTMTRSTANTMIRRRSISRSGGSRRKLAISGSSPTPTSSPMSGAIMSRIRCASSTYRGDIPHESRTYTSSYRPTVLPVSGAAPLSRRPHRPRRGGCGVSESVSACKTSGRKTRPGRMGQLTAPELVSSRIRQRPIIGLQDVDRQATQSGSSRHLTRPPQHLRALITGRLSRWASRSRRFSRRRWSR